MQYDLAILIPTYKRNQDLFDAIGSVYKAVLTSNMKICIMIIDNDVDNNINFTEFNDRDIFYKRMHTFLINRCLYEFFGIF